MCVYTYVYIYIYICIHTRISLSLSLSLCVCIYIYIYMIIYIYIHVCGVRRYISISLCCMRRFKAQHPKARGPNSPMTRDSSLRLLSPRRRFAEDHRVCKESDWNNDGRLMGSKVHAMENTTDSLIIIRLRQYTII